MKSRCSKATFAGTFHCPRRSGGQAKPRHDFGHAGIGDGEAALASLPIKALDAVP
jgi:hypothetical protein